MATSSSRQKPRKPYASFPLTPHPNGQWCKKIRGQLRFFGVWSEPEAAHVRYLEQAADRHAGREPSVLTEELTVKELANQYLHHQAEKLASGEIGARWFEDCRRILKDFAGAVGKTRAVADLRPSDFQEYRARLTRRLGVHALARTITVVKALFRYGTGAGLIQQSPKIEHVFRKPTATQVRKSKQAAELKNGKKLFTPEQVRQIIDASPAALRPSVLLGINGGFGNTDCATLPVAAVDLERAVIHYSRPKTGVQRVVPLWDETVEALKELLAESLPVSEWSDGTRLVFTTESGRPLVRQMCHYEEDGRIRKVTYIDRLGDQFDAVLRALGLKRHGIGFYSLRHTFRTWADETKDQHAIHRIMGHAIPGMSGIYVEEIELTRLRAVVEHVRRKLFEESCEAG